MKPFRKLLGSVARHGRNRARRSTIIVSSRWRPTRLGERLDRQGGLVDHPIGTARRNSRSRVGNQAVANVPATGRAPAFAAALLFAGGRPPDPVGEMPAYPTPPLRCPREPAGHLGTSACVLVSSAKQSHGGGILPFRRGSTTRARGRNEDLLNHRVAGSRACVGREACIFFARRRAGEVLLACRGSVGD